MVLKQSYEPSKDLHNIFPTIEHKKKASMGSVNRNTAGSPGGLVKKSYYNSNANHIGHYKHDYLKMVQKEADKQISDAIRYSSPLSYDTKGPNLNRIKEALFQQQKKEYDQNAFENSY